MDIVHIAAELSPIAKVGGLAEAVFGLLHSLSQKEKISIILPYYSFIDSKKITSLKKDCSIEIQNKKKTHKVEIFKGKIDDFTVVLLKEKNFFGKKNIYGYKNDNDRFLFLSKASLEYLTQSKIKIDILHIHDWHTSACLPLYHEIFQDKGLKIGKVVLSIHNLCYQGICLKKDLEEYGIIKTSALLKNESGSGYNLLKGGILLADQVITVSPTYSKEILKKEHSFGLFKTLNRSKNKIIGLLNGIDSTIWNPSNDKFLASKFSSKMALDKIKLAKGKNKKALLKKVTLKDSNKPLISFIGRLTEQKGLELIKHAITKAQSGKYTFILLGSSTETVVQKNFEKLKKDLKAYNNIHLHLGFNEELAHLIYAASDYLIIPSQFEPCGLVQLIAFHYATIPIARSTGGLKDTIIDNKDNKGTGYLFSKYDEKAFDKVLNKALNIYGTKEHFSLMKRAFMQNYCWTKAIDGYIKTYQKLLKEV